MEEPHQQVVMKRSVMVKGKVTWQMKWGMFGIWSAIGVGKQEMRKSHNT